MTRSDQRATREPFLGRDKRRTRNDRDRKATIPDPAPPATSASNTPDRPQWRILVISTLITAVITTIVTLASTGVIPLWKWINQQDPLTTRVDRRPVPLPESSSTDPAATTEADGSAAAWAAQVWALPATVDSTTAPWTGHITGDNFGTAFGAWATAAGGADVGATTLRLTVTAQDRDVTIDAVCARVVGAPGPAMNGTLFFREPQGEDDPAPASVNLDSADPCAPELGRTPLQVEAKKNRVIDLAATTRSRTVTWYPELSVVVNGERKTLALGKDKPYRTTALLDDLASYGHYFEYQYDASSPDFRETLPDPDRVEQIRRLVHGRAD